MTARLHDNRSLIGCIVALLTNHAGPLSRGKKTDAYHCVKVHSLKVNRESERDRFRVFSKTINPSQGAVMYSGACHQNKCL